MRALVALLTTFAFGLAAYRLGAPPGAAALAALGALTAAAIAFAGITQKAPQEPAAPIPAQAPSPEPGPTLEELMNAIDDPSLLIVKRRVVRANPAARELLGEHIVGEDVRLAIRHPAAAERLVGEIPPEDGDTRQAIELVGIGERDRPWELVIHELSGQARFVRLADRSRTHAAEKMRVDFVANASHELRTPLASLLGYIETLQDGAAKDKKTRNRFLEIMHGEASRMQRLIGDLMSLSRIEAEKYRAPAEEIALGPLVIEASRAATAALGADPARLIFEEGTEVETIPGDPAQLAQLVNNLVGNALKYGSADTPVTVAWKPIANDMVRLTVADQGEGIPPEHLPRLTERFYRVDASRSRSMGGTGLGLAIVKHIVERHRGRLDVESVVGEGTVVTVDLPTNPPPVSSSRNANVTRAGTEPRRAAHESHQP